PTDRISGHPPLHFDLSTFDVFGTFAAGAELHLVPPELNLLPHQLAELIRDARLTQWFSVPSVLNYMAKFEVVKEGDFPSLRRVAPGDVGQLYIRGVGLSPGYWRDAEKTRGAFLPYPGSSDPEDRIYRTGDLASVGADGLIRFLGRADSQIKARGYRIELGEIEAALHPVETLQECAIVGVPSRDF